MSRQTIYLCEGHQPAPVVYPLFRKLADLARPGHYTTSDLMHDAIYLHEAVEGGEVRTVYWSTREGGGTWIGPTAAAVNAHGGGERDTYHVLVHREERGHWEATITQIGPEGEEL